MLSTYTRARAVYAANGAAADERAAALAQDACASYDSARQQYAKVASRYDARVTHVLPPMDDLDVMHDIATYTSSRAPDMVAYYDDCPRRPDTRAIDAELRQRAERRRRDSLQDATARALSEEANCTATTLLQRRRAAAQSRWLRMAAQLQQRQYDEYADLCEIEQEHFRRLAKIYYESVFGAIDDLLWREAQDRQLVEDAEVNAMLGLLARLRDELVACEQDRVRRSMGLDSEYVERRRREAAEAAAVAERVARVLDSMRAVPLLQRTMAIRQETVNEEEMAYRYLLLAFHTQGDLIADGYLRYNAQTGLLERDMSASVPARKRDAVSASFQLARLCLELDEESARMRLVDAAVDAEVTLSTVLTQQLLASNAAAVAHRLPWRRAASGDASTV